MTKYAEIQARIAALQIEAEQVRKEEISNAITQIKALMASNGITLKDLQGTPKKSRKATSTAEVKYRDPTTGKEWSGRGRSPKWLEGKNKEDFKV